MKKRGKKIKNAEVRLPLGIKKNDYEFYARAALVALEGNCANEMQLTYLWSLAELCSRMAGSNDIHIVRHAETLDRLVTMVKEGGYTCSNFAYASIKVSADILLRWFAVQKNKAVSSQAMAVVGEIDRRMAE